MHAPTSNEASSACAASSLNSSGALVELPSCNSTVRPPSHFPHCIVWTPIPLVTWLYPFIGHMGICSSAGVIYDFAGLGVTRGALAFGNPTRFAQLDIIRASALLSLPNIPECWDRALEYSASVYDARTYNPCTSNCHHFVQHFLENIKYGDCTSCSIVRLGALVFFHGVFVGWLGFFKTVGPCVVTWALALYFGQLWFVFAWLALLASGGAIMGTMRCLRPRSEPALGVVCNAHPSSRVRLPSWAGDKLAMSMIRPMSSRHSGL